MGSNPNYTGEPQLLMLWNAILNTHFPASMGYTIAFHKSGDQGDPTTFLVVKLQAREESTVLVMGFKKPGGDTTPGREAVEKATTDYAVGPGFDDTDFSEIYTVSSVGLSWTCSKLVESASEEYGNGSKQPHRVVDWTTNMTSAHSFEKMREIARKINDLTQRKAEEAFNGD